MGMLNFPTTKGDSCFYLIACLEETLSLIDPHLVIMFINLVAHLHLFNIGSMLFLLGLSGLFFLLKFVFAVIHNPTDGRYSSLTNQNQIEFSFFSNF